MAEARDTYVSESDIHANYGERSTLLLNGDGSGDDKHVLLWFPDPFRRTDERVAVSQARIHLTAKGTNWAGTDNDIVCDRIDETWSEDDATWSGEPAIDTSNETTHTVSDHADGDEIVIDVTDMMQDVADGLPWHGVRLALGTIEAAGNFALYSAESGPAGLRPVLVVKYLYAPDKPDVLHPDNDVAVSNATPHLRWNFESESDDDDVSQTYLQVQVSEDPDDFDTTPTFDSGDVASTEERYHLDSYPGGLVNESDYYWRVRTRDQSGLHSPWSEIASFKYFNGGTLTITYPVNNDDAVDDSTPTIAWTFTGRTQEFFELALYKNDADIESNLIYHVPRRASTATEWEIPSEDSHGNPIIKHESPTDYIVDVTVWDDKKRGFADGVSKRRRFNWVNGEDADPITDFTIELDGPRLLLKWQRAGVPDDFAIVDADPDSDTHGDILKRLDPADVQIDATHYHYRMYDVRPGRRYQFKLMARTDSSKWSARVASDPASIRFTMKGIYVINRQTHEFVHLLGQEHADTDLGQAGETFPLLNRRDPVRILGGTRGWEGTIAGVIATHDDTTAHEWLKRMKDFMVDQSISGVLHLMYGSRSYRAIIGEFRVDQWPEVGEQVYNVSFNSWQVADYEVTD